MRSLVDRVPPCARTKYTCIHTRTHAHMHGHNEMILETLSHDSYFVGRKRSRNQKRNFLARERRKNGCPFDLDRGNRRGIGTCSRQTYRTCRRNACLVLVVFHARRHHRRSPSSASLARVVCFRARVDLFSDAARRAGAAYSNFYQESNATASFAPSGITNGLWRAVRVGRRTSARARAFRLSLSPSPAERNGALTQSRAYPK